MTGRGVRAGACMPNQAVASKPGTTVSARVGTSGSTALRTCPVTASGRSRPSRIWPMQEGRLSTEHSSRPATASISMGPAPRKGTCVICSPPARSLNISIDMCGEPPLPALP